MTAALRAGPADPVVLTCHQAPANPRERVLFLHGLANSSAVWRTAVGRWPHGAELWTADLPWRLNHRGDWSRQGDPHAHVAEAVARVPGGADVIVAHSFAANLVLEALGAADPALPAPRALVLVSPFYRAAPGDFTWPDIEDFPSAFRRIVEAGIELQASGGVDPALRGELVTRVCALVGPYGWASFLQTYLRTPQLALERLRLPCLVVAGADDFCPPPAESLALAAALPDACTHLLPGVGHFAMVQSPGSFVSRAAGFVADVRARESGAHPMRQPKEKSR